MGMWKTYRNPSKGMVDLPWGGRHRRGEEGRHVRRLRDEGSAGWHAVMQAAGQPSETLANQPTRGEANKQPSDPPVRQSASQPAIQMPFRHLFASCHAPFSISLPSIPPFLPSLFLFISFHMYLSLLFHFPFAFLPWGCV